MSSRMDRRERQARAAKVPQADRAYIYVAARCANQNCPGRLGRFPTRFPYRAESSGSKEKRILQQLDLPTGDYQDASPKGSVDENIRELVSDINRQEGYVTTSSCGGRVAVYCEGQTKANAGGKGGGKWLFTSHQQVDDNTSHGTGELFKLLGLPAGAEILIPATITGVSFVHFKFEPMILHILTASLEHAQQAQTAAMDAGFRESGISGISPSGNKPTMPMVAVRTTGLSFDCIIAYQEVTSTGDVRTVPMVSEAYVHTLISVANERFGVNDERKERFRQAFLVRTKK
nr:trna wybutosine-synthesizing protein 3 [Quercus suber]